MMSVMTVETKVTRSYLLNKTKNDLSSWVLTLLDEVERLRELAELAQTYIEDGAPNTAVTVLKKAGKP
jgi:hypothetical protein